MVLKRIFSVFSYFYNRYNEKMIDFMSSYREPNDIDSEIIIVSM